MKKDITHHDDIVLLVDTFYEKVKWSKIGFIFSEVAKVNWPQHLPVMYAFWSGILLGEPAYNGNPMTKHIALSKITPMTELEFTEWLHLFTATVDELFEGENATEAKVRAGNIARLMLHKIQTG